MCLKVKFVWDPLPGVPISLETFPAQNMTFCACTWPLSLAPLPHNRISHIHSCISLSSPQTLTHMASVRATLRERFLDCDGHVYSNSKSCQSCLMTFEFHFPSRPSDNKLSFSGIKHHWSAVYREFTQLGGLIWELRRDAQQAVVHHRLLDRSFRSYH